MLPMQGTCVQSLVRELDPTYHNWDQMQPNRYLKKGCHSSVWNSVALLAFAGHTSGIYVLELGSDGKASPIMQEIRVQSLGWEDFLEKEMATHSSILARKIPWMEESGRLQSMGSQRVGQDWATSLSLFIVQLVKNLPAMQEIPVQFLGQEDPLEKG